MNQGKNPRHQGPEIGLGNMARDTWAGVLELLSFMPQIHELNQRGVSMAHFRYLRTFIDEEAPAEAMARSKSQPALGRPAMEASEEAPRGFMNLRLRKVYQNSLRLNLKLGCMLFCFLC